MNQISELKGILKQFSNWNNARLTCFTHMLLALFTVRSVNLREIAVAFSSKALIDSRYKRCKRFFAQFKMELNWIAVWVFKLFFVPNGKYYLTIDRTNWFWGKSKINILTLGIAHEGVAIPLLWDLLDKAGNATAKEHQQSIERFISIFGCECIAGVLGDREFASGTLFKWFNENQIPFYIRIKEDSIVNIKGKKLWPAVKIFNDLNPKTKKYYAMAVEVYGQKIYLAGSRSERGELMIIATNQHPKNAICIYLRRWEIETLFACLKSKGFRFEETHLTQLERIEKLMALLVVGFCWAHKVGEWRAELRPIKWNQYRDSKRPQFSFFRYGLDWIRDIVLHAAHKTAELTQLIAQLIPVMPDDCLVTAEAC